MLARLKAMWAAFTADHHTVAMNALATVATADGKVALTDVQKAFDSARDALKAKQTDYWHTVYISAGVAVVAFFLGHKI
jgi:hypothetical protein